MCNENTEPYKGQILTGTHEECDKYTKSNLSVLCGIPDYKSPIVQWVTEWKDCPVFMCKHKVCLALNSDRCFKHTKGLRLWKLFKIWYNNKFKK